MAYRMVMAAKEEGKGRREGRGQTVLGGRRGPMALACSRIGGAESGSSLFSPLRPAMYCSGGVSCDTHPNTMYGIMYCISNICIP